MKGYDVFKAWFDELSEEKKKEILGDIFKIDDVSVYSFYREENRIVFQLYAKDVFYRYNFIYDEEMGDKVRIHVHKGKRVVLYQILMGKDFHYDKEARDKFLGMEFILEDEDLGEEEDIL